MLKADMNSKILFCLTGLSLLGAAAAYAQPRPALAPVQPSAPVIANPTYTLPDQKVAKELAEDLYNTWRVSMQRGNESAWRKVTSTSRQTRIRNTIVSQKGQFPRDFFRNQPAPPALEQFSYVGALAGADGSTLAVTYLGNLQLGNGPAEENAYVLQFICEKGVWTFDQANFFNLSKLPEVKKRLHAKDLAVLREQDGFRPYDIMPAAPAACKAPELIGKVFVDAPGRDIEMRINGISAHSFSDERRADIISGGLKRGQNTITYTIRTDKGKAHPSMAIGLFVMPETQGNHPVCVFDHILDEKDTAQGGSFTFTIDNNLIGSMNPNFRGEAPPPFHAVPLKAKK